MSAVGLKPGKAGNSEAGHMNIGAGRIVMQDDVRLDQAMQDGSFSRNPILLQAIDPCQTRIKTALHLIGLLTEKSSHGSIDYPLAILTDGKVDGLSGCFPAYDFRWTQHRTRLVLLPCLRCFPVNWKKLVSVKLLACIGRGIALDRDGNYAKTEKAYRAFVDGIGTSATLE